mmetsp:Transcript_1065/g.2835  ORF Transcript_1065/g.2835 Transcript_1065/m.2835 type:complete len:103 (-) Transcript_1065:1034-1342(-)|eukprot:scaffold303267_cov31-Tisochrysis_lutea.AAC.3
MLGVTWTKLVDAKKIEVKLQEMHGVAPHLHVRGSGCGPPESAYRTERENRPSGVLVVNVLGNRLGHGGLVRGRLELGAWRLCVRNTCSEHLVRRQIGQGSRG